MARKSHRARGRWVAIILLFCVRGIVGLAKTCGDAAPPAEQGAPAAPARCSTARPFDQLWLVSCRGVSFCPNSDHLAELSYLVHQPTGGWTSASEEAFRDEAAVMNTCVLALGNGYTAAETRSLGESVYHRLVDGLPPECGVRFVVWSWPSDHVDHGAIRDSRVKAGRTPYVALILAQWLDVMPPPGQLSLLGTSFGAKVVMEALELRAGGHLGNLRLERQHDAHRPAVHAVLISAAMDDDWLLPGHRLGQAISQTEQLLLVSNSVDPVLRKYHWLYGRRSHAVALGSGGLPWDGHSGRLTQIDAATLIGRHHGCDPFFDSPPLVAAMRSHLFGVYAETPQLPIPLAARPARQAHGNQGGWQGWGGPGTK